MEGPEFYDNSDVFNAYQRSRERAETPNDTLEKPIIMDLIDPIDGKRVLDLGCGDGAFGREALALGATRYVGVEGSKNMVAAARETLAGTSSEIIASTLENWNYPANQFDVVVSRLVLHYIDDLAAVFAGVHKTLTDGGQFLFSAEHPVITSSDRGWVPGTPRMDWLVDNYFDTGERVTTWMGGEVRKYHRTVEDYFMTAQQAGFSIEYLREGRPQRENFSTEETYQRRKRIPLFLIMSLRR